jgi:hypothetical protein
MQNCCQGVTLKLVQCKNKGNFAGFCRLHQNQANGIKFLPVGEDWPTSLSIISSVFKVITLDHLITYSKGLVGSLKTPRAENRLHRRTVVIKMVEFFKFNVNICYGEPRTDRITKLLIARMNEIAELAEYTEDFKRKCLKTYRDQARKSLTAFYFKHIEGLCPDVIELIISFI